MPEAKPFHFKQFTVKQLASVFKVGTDGVLLGAWTNVQQSKSIVDLGCGTGLISLMLAQRNLNTQITAIDINKDAVNITSQNFQNSPWSERLKAIKSDLNKLNITSKFDTIVSNPPYFRNSLKPNSDSNIRSKHDSNFDLKKFAIAINYMTKNQSRVSVILPPNESRDLQFYLEETEFTLVKKCHVYPTPTKTIERCLMEFAKGRTKQGLIEEKLVIQNSGKRHDYTNDFVDLMREYYTIL